MVAIATGQTGPEAGIRLPPAPRHGGGLRQAAAGRGARGRHGPRVHAPRPCGPGAHGGGARLRAPFAEMGVPPEAASSWLLPERLGWQRAAALLLASEWIDADQAVEAGLALRVCADGHGGGRDHGPGPAHRRVPAQRHPRHQTPDDGRPPPRHRGRQGPGGGGVRGTLRRSGQPIPAPRWPPAWSTEPPCGSGSPPS